jgi:23S rRNA pseudouridine2605 synthase
VREAEPPERERQREKCQGGGSARARRGDAAAGVLVRGHARSGGVGEEPQVAGDRSRLVVDERLGSPAVLAIGRRRHDRLVDERVAGHGHRLERLAVLDQPQLVTVASRHRRAEDDRADAEGVADRGEWRPTPPLGCDELDHRVLGPLHLHDRRASLHALEDARHRKLAGEDQRGGIADRAVEGAARHARAVIVAPADGRDLRSAIEQAVPERDGALREDLAALAEAAGRDLDRPERGGVDVVLPRAADAEIADVEGRVVHGHDGPLGADGLEPALDGDARKPDLVIDPGGRADGVRVTGVGRVLDARKEEEIGSTLVRSREKIGLRDDVVIADLHEIEAAGPGEGHDGVEGGDRVARLARVDVEVAGVPARLGGAHRRRRVRRARIGGKGGLGAEIDGDPVARGEIDDLGLADHHAPGSRGDGPGDIGARRRLHPDDGRLGVAAAPAAKAAGVVEPPVEDVGLREVVVGDLDLLGPGRDLEGNEEMIRPALGHLALQDQGRRLGACGRGKGGQDERGREDRSTQLPEAVTRGHQSIVRPMERIQKILARGGIASRRAAEALITAGRVRINGHVVSELGAKADPRRDKVEVDGKRVVAEMFVYVVLHKPRGVVSTMSDPEGRPTVRELFARLEGRIYPVGRLDFATSGVLLATNDGEFAEALLHPKRAVPKTYVVKVKGVMKPDDLDAWRKGVRLEDGMTLPAEAKLIRHEEGKTWFELTIKEGRNQQIRRMGEATGFPVMRLARQSFAGVTIEGLRPGAFRQLTRDELVQLKKTYGVPRSVSTPIAPQAPGRRPAPSTTRGPAPRKGTAGRDARAYGTEAPSRQGGERSEERGRPERGRPERGASPERGAGSDRYRDSRDSGGGRGRGPAPRDSRDSRDSRDAGRGRGPGRPGPRDSRDSRDSGGGRGRGPGGPGPRDSRDSRDSGPGRGRGPGGPAPRDSRDSRTTGGGRGRGAAGPAPRDSRESRTTGGGRGRGAAGPAPRDSRDSRDSRESGGSRGRGPAGPAPRDSRATGGGRGRGPGGPPPRGRRGR